MKLSDYLKSIDNLDEKMEKAVIIAGYEKMFGFFEVLTVCSSFAD